MATINKSTYFIVKYKHGNDYLCPLDAVKDRDAVSDQEFDECFEKDVVERYSGNIEIESAYSQRHHKLRIRPLNR